MIPLVTEKRPFLVLLGDALEQLRQLPDNYFHCCVTSPPYYLLRDYGVNGQLGQEPTWADFLDKLVAIFREVRRVLRDDAPAWVNMGDGHVQSGKGRADGGETKCSRAAKAKSGEYPTQAFNRQRVKGWQRAAGSAKGMNLKPKQLMGQPWRLAFALQDDGWWLRQDIVWHKPNAMPDSAKDRPGKSHEYLFELIPEAPDHGYLFQLAPSRYYFYDREGWKHPTRFARSVWTMSIARKKNTGHTATFPDELAERCILLGTSEKGCCSACGQAWIRQVRPTAEYAKHLGASYHDHKDDKVVGHRGTNCGHSSTYYETVGWNLPCECDAETVPCRVLDPFSGSASTGIVALRNGRQYVGIELKPEFVAECLPRLAAEAKTPRQLSLLESV